MWFDLASGANCYGGFFAVYSYIAPLVTDVAEAPEWAVPITLVLVGVGMTVGNLLGGVFADRDLRRTLLAGLAGLALVLVLLALLASSIVLLMGLAVLVGLVSSVLAPAIQTRLMDVAGENQSIAAALNHSALNIGNSLGAFVGGVTISMGLGFTSPAWVGALLALLGLGIALLAFRLERSRVVAF